MIFWILSLACFATQLAGFVLAGKAHNLSLDMDTGLLMSLISGAVYPILIVGLAIHEFCGVKWNRNNRNPPTVSVRRTVGGGREQGIYHYGNMEEQV